MKRQLSKKQENGKKPRLVCKPVAYPKVTDFNVKTFHIKYEKRLSKVAKLVLNSFRAKYVYYAIDDIFYLLKSKPIERDKLLAVIYSPLISLQNNLSINFFDIWIYEIYIHEVLKFNKFLNHEPENLEQVSYITIKFAYKSSSPIEKLDLSW